jgi:hypothetical protein
MIKPTLQFLTAGSLNYLLVIFSKDIDVEQLLKDFDSIGFVIESNSGFISLFISVSASVLTLSLIYFFKPFNEMFLVHHQKLSFYFLINLVSLSSIYIVFRIYGYSRLYLLFYLLITSIIFYLLDKILN